MVEGKVIPRPAVAIIGAGLAGITAGVSLARKGFRVVLLEKKALPGGRTFSFPTCGSDRPLDNGQHVLMGCYTSTFQFLHELHSGDVRNNGKYFFPVHSIEYRDLNRRCAVPRSIAGLLMFGKWTWLERFTFLLRFRKILQSRSAQNMPIRDTMKQYGQTKGHIRYFWEPLCLAVMNETLDSASPVIFFAALRKMFSSKQNRLIFIPAVSLHELLIRPALNIIEECGGEVRYQSQVKRIIISGERSGGIELSNGQVITADYYISAAPVWDLMNILSPEQQQRLWNEPLTFHTSPIVSAYIGYDRLPDCFDASRSMIGCFGDVIQWVFVRSDDTIAITVSSANTLIDETMENLKVKIKTDLRLLFGESSIMSIQDFTIIKQRKATFSLRVNQRMFRPSNETPLKNLFIAGDWTDTGLPSTIESAVRSGYGVAEKIMKTSV